MTSGVISKIIKNFYFLKGIIMKIYFLAGQSNTGKDTITSELLREIPDLNRYVYNTTRPIREGEIDGVTYNFVTDDKYEEDSKANRVIESRFYNANFGKVVYYTPVIERDDKKYILTGTVDMCRSLVNYYGSDIVHPIFICVSDRERLIRGILREDHNKQDYKEVARRFYDEFTEYTPENIESLGNIFKVNNDNDIRVCVQKIKDYIENL